MSSQSPSSSHDHILVLGPSGAGKTHIAKALRSQGLNALDADTVPGLCGWFDAEGNRVPFPPDAGQSFLDSHTFLWDRVCLTQLLEREASLYFFGISRNAFDMLDVFDRAFFLTVPSSILTDRLQDASRMNPMGKTDYQLQFALSMAKHYEDKARSLGLPMIDATYTPNQVLLHITTLVSL